MLSSLKSISFDKFSPRLIDCNGSISSMNHNNQVKSVRYINSLPKQEDPLKRHFLPQSLSSERRSGLVPLNKVMNKSHSSTALHKTGFKMAAKSSTPQNDEIAENNTTIDNKSMIRLFSTTDLRPISIKTSNRRRNARDLRAQYFKKGNEEAEDVKQLDNWQLEMRKKKILSNDNQYEDMLKKEVGSKDSHQMTLPKINTQLIDRIFKDSDDEDDAKKKKVETMSEAIKALVPDRNKEESHKSLDVRIFEKKEDIGNMLVIKKVKQYLKNHNTETLNSENLNSQAESIARETFNHFKSMKGVFARNNVINCVKLVTENKQLEKHHEGLFDTSEREKYLGKVQDKEALINYKEIEINLRKSLESANDTINALTWKRSHLKGEAKRIQYEYKQFEDQLNQIAARELELTVVQPASILKKNKEQKIDLKNDHISKTKEELKHQRVEIQQKLENVKGRLQIKENEIISVEKDLKEVKEDKSKSKLQLKDLYLNLLKDEIYILKSTSIPSYVWVVQALWNLGKKLEEDNFPEYLDKDALHYTIEYARKQDMLLKFCHKHNLLDAIPDTESFKYSNAKDMTALIKNAMSPAKTGVNSFGEEKTYSSILSDFQERMKKMKRENLKIKEQINPLNIGFRSAKAVAKMRYIVSSQIPSNETQSFHQSIIDNDSKLFSMAVDANSISNNKGLKIEILNNPDESADLQTVKNLLDELDCMKIEEKDRMLKKYITKEPDLRQKESIIKVYIFLFGKQEGREFFNELCKKQKIYHQKEKYGSTEGSNSPKLRSHTPSSSPLRGSQTKVWGDQKIDITPNILRNNQSKDKDSFEVVLKLTKNSDFLGEPIK